MRAVVLRDGRLGVREIADPVPGPGELLLRTLSTAICASDVHFMDHPEMGVDDPTGRSLYDANRDIVLGHEFVGEIVGHGPGCTEQFPVGTRVTSIPIRLVNGGADGVRIIGQHPEAQGSFGELVVVAEAMAKPVDGDVASDAVALTDAFAVGEFYVRSARMQPGEIPVRRGRRDRIVGGRRAGRPWRRADHRVGLQIRSPRAGARQLRGAYRR
jgi:threonine dehydrogenase-like Zn-dependent dehydrogenase